jgi:coenzyme F420-0:L-glutamate ligase / coenzyme F420-1:gamma-L-glutamate ligase
VPRLPPAGFVAEPEPPAAGYSVRAVTGIGEVRPGDDLADLIMAAAAWIRDGDILVVTSKIVSKAEGQLVDVPAEGAQREAIREALLTAETARPVARRGPVRIVQTHHGFVMAAAGIDESNVDRSRMVLLPKDPDASAKALRAALKERFGLDVKVIITDTMGRPWRLGLVDVAIGAAGIAALDDYRGTLDAYGNDLQITQVAVIDELAAAADLVKGKREQVPVAVVRGIEPHRSRSGRDGGDDLGAAALLRPSDEDLFSLGTAEARVLGLREAGSLVDADRFGPGPIRLPADLPFVAVPVDTVADLVPAHTAAVLVPAAPASDLPAAARLGAEVYRWRIRLAADGLASAWLTETPPILEHLVDGAVPLGLLAIGRPAQLQ